MRKSFKKRSNQILSVFVLLPFIAQTFVTPLLALDEVLPEIQVEEDISETEVDIPIDTSEDILEEGISDPEEIAKPIWVTTEGSATTFSPVVLGEKYVYPHNSDVTVVFSSLPEVSGTLTIKTVYLTDEQVKATNAASNVAYDITTDMVDGTFNYDLTLPKVGESTKVVYAESVNELVDAKDISNVIENESSLKIEDLDHFTTFVVVSTIPSGITEGTTEVNSNCTAVQNTSNTKCYDTIQEAVTAAVSGEKIIIQPGTYTISSQLVIDKNLEISGLGMNNTTIVPGFNTGSVGDSRGWILVNNNAKVTVSNLTFDGSGYHIYQAIRANDAEFLNLNNISFKDISYDDLYLGFAVAYMDTAGTINNISFENIQRVGLTLYYGNSNLNVANLSYKGKGDGNWLDYAIEVGGGGHLNLEGADISNCRGVASSDGSTSAGILVTTYFGAGSTANIENTNFKNNTLGLAVGYDSSDSSIVNIHNSDFSNNDEGVSSTKPEVNATNCKWNSSKQSEILAFNEGDILIDPWYGKTVTQEVTVNEYEKDGIYYVNKTETLDFSIFGKPIYMQNFNYALYGYDTTNQRTTTRYIGWEYSYPDSTDIVDRDVAWDMIANTGAYSGTNLDSGDYLLWVKRNYSDVNSSVTNSGMTYRITVDNQSPTILNSKMYVDENGDWGESYLTKSGDKVKIAIEVKDALTEVDKVQLWIRENPWNPNNNELMSGTMTKVDDTHFEFIYTVPFTYKDGDPINENFEGNYFNFRPYDTLGNSHIGWSRKFTIDNTAPVVALTSPSDNYYTNQTSVPQKWSTDATDVNYYEYRSCTNDPNDGYCNNEYKISTGETASRIVNNNNVIFWWQVRAIDTAGNVGNWSSARKITIDGVGPTVSFSGLRHYDYRYPSTPVDTTNTSTNDNTPIVLISASDSLSGMSSVTVNGQTATYEGGTYWVELTTLPEGTNRLIMVGTDNAGNITTLIQDIFVDTVAPTASYTYFKDYVGIVGGVTAFVKDIEQLSFKAEYLDDSPSSGILKDTYVIFDSKEDGSGRTSHAYCQWRNDNNTVIITHNPLLNYVEFTNCESTLSD